METQLIIKRQNKPRIPPQKLIRQESKKESIYHFFSRFIRNERDLEANVGLAQIYRELGYQSRWHFHLSNAHSINPFDINVQLLMFQREVDNRDKFRWMPLLKQIINFHVEVKNKVILNAANILYNAKCFDDVIEILKFFSKDQKSLPVYLQIIRVRTLMALKEYHRAYAILYRMINEQPCNEEVLALFSTLSQYLEDADADADEA